MHPRKSAMARRVGLFALSLALILSACKRDAAPTPPESGVAVLASTTILADIARHVTGDRTVVSSLLPPGADPHEYQAAPSDVQKVAKSTALIVNGLEYEHFIQPLLDNAGGHALVITASDGLQPRLLADQGSTGVPDPHMWLDPTRVIKYVENIRAGLSRVDPVGASVYEANAASYIAQLKDLDSWISGQVAAIPPERRLLVTNHESMGYFADHYGFKVVSAIIPSLSTEAGTSARELAAVIDQARALHAPAIFVGKLENADLARQIAAETGATVVDDLYLESLSSGPPAGSYIDMMKYDVERIVTALK